MNINKLNNIIKQKISKEILIEDIVIEDKTFLHLKHKNFQKNKYHLQIFIKSDSLSKMNKIDSTKKIYKILEFELKHYIHSIQIDFS
tara:strand:+ start:260 stop:520 length:261 start_codon:yes stop_codon:yes gene_type:complete